MEAIKTEEGLEPGLLQDLVRKLQADIAGSSASLGAMSHPMQMLPDLAQSSLGPRQLQLPHHDKTESGDLGG